MLVVSVAGSTRRSASTSSAGEQAKAKHYNATRAFIVEKQTGAVRMPTEQESPTW
jgi:hypothetical protein